MVNQTLEIKETWVLHIVLFIFIFKIETHKTGKMEII